LKQKLKATKGRDRAKQKAEIGKAEMNQGRLPVEFRERTKRSAMEELRRQVRYPFDPAESD
jgi:hypothetical protein